MQTHGAICAWLEPPTQPFVPGWNLQPLCCAAAWETTPAALRLQNWCGSFMRCLQYKPNSHCLVLWQLQKWELYRSMDFLPLLTLRSKEGQSKKRLESISHDSEKHNLFSSVLLNDTLEHSYGAGIITEVLFNTVSDSNRKIKSLAWNSSKGLTSFLPSLKVYLLCSHNVQTATLTG